MSSQTLEQLRTKYDLTEEIPLPYREPEYVTALRTRAAKQVEKYKSQEPHQVQNFYQASSENQIKLMKLLRKKEASDVKERPPMRK